MDGENGIKRRGWGLPASLAVHVLVAALVIFGLPTLPEHEPEEEAIAVTLEPPPEPAEAAPAEEPPAPPEPAETAPPDEPPAPPAQAEAPPPPAGSQPPPTGEQAAASLPALDPVVRFGETDAGPRQSLSGAGAEDAPDPSAALAPPDEPPTEDAPEVADQDQPEPITEAEAAEGEEQATGEEDGAATDALVASIVDAPDKAELPAASPTTTDPATTEPELREARTLFSRSATGGATATTAMANIPRGIRAGRLCASELRLQLLVSAYAPDILPSYRLDEGTVLRVMRGAFRAGGEWRNLSFECQVDPQATVVRSFAFNVGDPLSRDEAARRGLPVQ